MINQNYIYTQNRKNNNRIKVKRIKQTAWFLKQDGKLIIGTTVEKGKGCQVNYSSIYYSVNYGLSWEELIRIPKIFTQCLYLSGVV